MKKLLSLLLIACLALSLAACGNGTSSNETEASNHSDSDLSLFNKSATLSETVMVDEGGVKITATGLNYKDYAVELNLTIENNSGKDLSFISGSLGYSCNSVNGYMATDGYLNCDVTNGNAAKDSISFSYDELMICGIDEIAAMEIGFDISDDDYNHTYTGPRQIKTSAYDTHDNSKDNYYKTITNPLTKIAYNYDVSYASQDTLYDVSGVKLLSSCVVTNKDGDTNLLLEMENITDDMVYVSTSDISINGLVVCTSSWSSDAINPGKRCIIDIDLSSALPKESWSAYGITDIGSIGLSLSQKNADGTTIADKTPIEISIPGVKAKIDTTGNEVYNNGGLRIVAKKVINDSTKYSVLLLAENNSGKTLDICGIYDSLSVNGFMTDYFGNIDTLENGKCTVIVIYLSKSSLEDIGITSPSDVKEVEVKFEIMDGYNTIDEPTITMVFD